MSAPTTNISREGRIAVLTLDRPDALNALGTSVALELLGHVRALAADSDIGAVVLTGAGGRTFCAGADIAEMHTLESSDEFGAFLRALESAVAAVAALPQPTIAAIDGVAFGGGFELALACDFRIVGDSARLGLPEIKLGLLPGLGGTQRAIRMLPKAVAVRLVLLGEPLSAADAHHYGLCEPPVPAGTVLTAAMDLAARLAAGPRVALAAGKQLLREGAELPLMDALALEQQVGCRLFGTADAAEGIAAFLTRRVPSFEGR